MIKNLIDFFIHRSVVVNLLTFLIIVLGTLTAVFLLQKETFPRVDFNVVIVNAIYPGSSSEDVEKLVTIELERELKGISGLKDLDALSLDSQSVLYAEIDEDFDLDEVTEDIKTAVDKVTDLPEDVDRPIVRSLNNKTRSVIKVTLTGEDYDLLSRSGKKLRDELETLKFVSIVDLEGYRKDQIEILIDPLKLENFDVTTDEIHTAIKDRNINLSSGKFETKTGDIFVRVLADYEDLSNLENVVLRSNSSGVKVLLKDVAKISRAPEKGKILERSDGQQALFLNVKIKENADIIRSVDKIKSTTAEYIKNLKEPALNMRYTDDLSYYVKRRLGILTDSGLMGMILVVICLILFLDFKTAMVTSLGAPIAFMISFMAMDAMGVSINLISMFALILVLGMLVDDSIIVAEHFYQKVEDGMSAFKAAKEAAYETIAPVTATILTTMIAFGSLFFMGGNMGKFLWSVPAVVIICLIASWIECFFILPSHLADFCKKVKSGKRWYDKVTNCYSKILNKVLDWKGVVTFLFILVFAASVLMAKKTMRFELFPGDDVRTVFLQFKGVIGTPFEKTNQAAKDMEKMIFETLKKNEYEQIRTRVGKLKGQNATKIGSHYGSFILYLTPPEDRKRSTDEILKVITKKAQEIAKGYTITTEKLQGGPPRGKDLEIELTSHSLEVLQKVSKEVLASIRTEKGVLGPEIDFEEGAKQLVVSVNDSEARRLGLQTSQIGRSLRRLLSQDSITEVRGSDEDIEIQIKLDRKYLADISTLNLIKIPNNQGRRIPLTKVVNIEERPGAFVIRRKNGRRIFSVFASLNKKIINAQEAKTRLLPRVDDILKKYPEVKYEFTGENKNTNESIVRLGRSAVIAIACIFLILVIMFSNLTHPFIIMSAIPLGMMGVIFSFKVLNLALGFMALMGVVGLVGVVVNDSIVLVNFINKKTKGAVDLKKGILEASVSRFRPVLLTTVTTVAGLMPLAHPTVSKIVSFGLAQDSDPFLRPMAISFAWGLLFASLITLFFIPCLYFALERIKIRLNLRKEVVHS